MVVLDPYTSCILLLPWLPRNRKAEAPTKQWEFSPFSASELDFRLKQEYIAESECWIKVRTTAESNPLRDEEKHA